MGRPRARDVGIVVGELPPGPYNAITDVTGVLVGHTTLIDGEGALVPGTGPVRTGVTVILPHGDNLFREKVPGAVLTINGFGKPFGFEQVRELGTLEAPIALTNSLNVGLVADALVQHAIRQSPEIGIRTSSVNVLVAECNDGYLNDLQGRHVRAEHVFAALAGASDGLVAEGGVGGGTGMTCFGWKGGIGTASRVVSPEVGGYTIGALVQSNFGRPRDLIVAGHPVGRELQPPHAGAAPHDRGSAVVVLATDAPLDARQLHRLCVRAGPGLARTGSHIGPGSGDFVIAFATEPRIPYAFGELTTTRTVVADEQALMTALFPAVVEAVEEAVVNSLFVAETMTGRDGHVSPGLPVEKATR